MANVIHLRVDAPNPGDILTVCGSFERQTLWRRHASFLQWRTNIKDVTCPKCRAAYLVNALSVLFDECEPMTDQEISEELAAFGYDPDEIGRRFAELAKQALERVRLEQFNEADPTLL